MWNLAFFMIFIKVDVYDFKKDYFIVPFDKQWILKK